MPCASAGVPIVALPQSKPRSSSFVCQRIAPVASLEREHLVGAVDDEHGVVGDERRRVDRDRLRAIEVPQLVASRAIPRDHTAERAMKRADRGAPADGDRGERLAVAPIGHRIALPHDRAIARDRGEPPLVADEKIAIGGHRGERCRGERVDADREPR